MLNADFIDPLQRQAALARCPWTPGDVRLIRRLVNQRVPETETGIARPQHEGFAGHVMPYLVALGKITVLPGQCLHPA